MYTVRQIRDMHKKARDAGLSGAFVLNDAVWAQARCNGIGAEWMPKSLRALAGKLAPTLEPAAAIHDIHYHYCKSKADQRYADVEFLANSVRLARAAYKWFDPRQQIVIFRALRFYIALRLFGHWAWRR